MRRMTRSGIGTTSGFGLSAHSRDEMDSIHYATLQILQDTGIKVMSEEAPSYLVEDCTYWAPRSIVYDARNPNDDFVAEPNRVGFTTFGGCINVIDPATRKLRRATKQDCAVHNLEAMLSNTGKHIFLGADSAGALNVMAELAAACAGGKDVFERRPIFTVNVCPRSPLMLPQNTCDVIMESAKIGVGIMVMPMALSGGTSPVTMAGTLAIHNAEVLSSIVLAQLIRKGLPCTYGSSSTILDLRFGTTAIGAPEYGMINSSIAKLAQYYKLPSFVGGGASDSKVPDIQSGYEFTLSATFSALAGANVVFGSGVLEQGLTMDYAKLIMDAEMIRMVQIAIKGVTISDETLAFDVIHEVGPGGAYISHDHSFNFMNSQSRTELFDRRTRDDWMKKTRGEAMRERAYEAAANILENHKPYPLPDGAAEILREIVIEFDKQQGLKK